MEGSEQGTVEFKDVSFVYPTSSREALEHISFKVNKGETIAFIGATGSGKTTLMSLAVRFYDATSGQVLIDGKDIREYSFDALYDKLGYVTQKAVLFAGDIRENVLFGESSAPQTDETVKEAIDLAQAANCRKAARRDPCADHRGRHQCIRRTETEAVYCKGAGEKAGDPDLR